MEEGIDVYIELSGAGGLKPYEEKILARLSGIAVPPVTIIRGGAFRNDASPDSVARETAPDGSGQDKVTLHYDTSGMKPLTELAFGDMSELFFVVRMLLYRYQTAREHLLSPGRFFSAPESVFVRMGSGEAYPVFGNAAGNDVSPASQILPVIGELARHTRVPGVKGSLSELEKRIQNLNPGFEDMMNIAEDVEREWNGILPPLAS